MPEPDDLRHFFEDFRTRSLAAVAPPGIAAIRRRLLRRRLMRSAVAGLAAMAVVAVTLGSQWRQTSYPADVPTLSTTPSATASPSPDQVGAISSSSGSGKPTSATTSRHEDCELGVGGNGLVHNVGGYYIAQDDFLARCPEVKVPLYLAVYHWSSTARKFVLYQTVRFSLTAARPKVKRPAIVKPTNWERCGYVALYIQLWPSSPPNPPSALPTDKVLVDPIAQTDFTNRLGLAVEDEWRTWSIAEMVADPQCTPPSSSPASPKSAEPTATATG